MRERYDPPARGGAERALRRTFWFSGRAGRAEFWWWMLVFAVVQLVLYLIAEVVPLLASLPATLAELLLFLPTVSVAVRRLHDTDRSGWYVLVWSALPVPAWMLLGWVFLLALGAGLAGGDPSPVPFFITLGIAVASTAAVLAWAIWWLSRPGDAYPNRYGP